MKSGATIFQKRGAVRSPAPDDAAVVVAVTTMPNPSTKPPKRTATETVALEDISAALRALPHGGLDDSTRRLEITPAAQTSLAPMISALRWAAVAFGMIFSTKSALRGDVGAVVGLAIVIFITSWRSILPLRLGSTKFEDRLVVFTDALLLGGAVGYSSGPKGAINFCVFVAVAVAALGWGYVIGFASAATAYAGMTIGALIDGHFERAWSSSAGSFALGLVVSAVLGGLVRTQLINAEHRRRDVAGRLDTLTETNDLLILLNSVARTLPATLNQREAIANIRDELLRPFQPGVICLFEYDEVNEEWVPKLAEGCVLRPTSTTGELPPALAAAVGASRPLLRTNLSAHTGDAISAGSGSGMYVELRARSRVVGLLGLEHPVADHFDDRDRRLLGGLADVLALTLDNARRFGRLRSLGAEEERTRIARDLHDRLGQWLTYISFELERIIVNGSQDAPQLSRLYQDVQRALEELRETLRQLRSEVTIGRPLSMVGKELVDRFVERTEIDVDWLVSDPGEHLPVGVENELLRILQESLSNIDKHADAHHVEVSWDVEEGSGTLRIHDDGRGFEMSRGIRDNAYGLVGMRERADAIGARLVISSAPEAGTTVTVIAGSDMLVREG
jgi:signal transduction histidine kinase